MLNISFTRFYSGIRSFDTLQFVLSLSIFCFFTPAAVFCQEYSYVNYNVKDGLASSTVYDICQGPEGFIWFATDAGLSRFDGNRFKNFGTEDGLPDIEIILLFPDSKGRIWIAPFKNSLSYYYQGKIHNQENDSLLRDLKLPNAIFCIQEDQQHNIAFLTPETVVYLSGNPEPGQPAFKYFNKHRYEAIFTNPHGDGIYFMTMDSIYLYKKNSWATISAVRRKDDFCTITTPDLSNVYLKKRPYWNTALANKKGDKIILINTISGCLEVDTTTGTSIKDIYLPDKSISRSLIDNEKNIWFGTQGEGVFKLVSKEFKTFHFSKFKPKEIYSLLKKGDQLFAGSGRGEIYTLSGQLTDSLNFHYYLPGTPLERSANRVTAISATGNDNIIFGMDGQTVSYNTRTKKSISRFLAPVKSVIHAGFDSMLISTGYGTFLTDYNLTVKDTIEYTRCTASTLYKNQFYIGYLDGFRIKNDQGATRYPGKDIPVLRHRVSSFLQTPDGSLWIATMGGGLVQWDGNKITRHFTIQQGMTSNVCRALYFQNNTIWIGTDKGINKLQQNNGKYTLSSYTTADGLPSGLINSIVTDGNIIYIGTPAGLTYFDESNIRESAMCRLVIDEVAVSNQKLPIRDTYEFPYQSRNIRFAFVGLSFKSGGDMHYRYRIKGLSNDWDTTQQNSLEFPTLSSGNYELEIIAINKFGLESQPRHIAFTVATPYWQTLWFRILAVTGTAAITWYLVAWRFRTVRKQEQEKARLHHKLGEMEQVALRAQMNPHFIFNSLNSIQSFIIKNDLESSNQYLTEFAHLIRQTMDNSKKGITSIENEMLYLNRYLEMEKMRFGDAFTYSVEVDPQIDKSYTFIPTMILQPFVENSIRHGLRYSQKSEKKLSIQFIWNNNHLLCIVEDNGIGRKKAQELKSSIHVEYQSKGMTITEERIRLINQQHSEPITLVIEDLQDKQQVPCGTRIAISFPASILTNLKPY